MTELFTLCNTENMEGKSTFGFRPNDEDRQILTFLEDRLGVGFSQIVRIAIRRLAEAEKRKE